MNYDKILLNNDTAIMLYDHIKDLPIIDYHCHLSPKKIAENYHYKNIQALWLDGDHYKWRVLRASGVSEKYITGDASSFDKFSAWAEVLSKALANPLQHWSYLELKQYFNVNELLCLSNAKAIYTKCNELMQDDAFKVQNIIKNSNVELLCTTDDPIDTLEYHKAYAQNSNTFKMLPTFRPDHIINIETDYYLEYLNKLSAYTNTNITNLDSLISAISYCINNFKAVGCIISDHAFKTIKFNLGKPNQVNEIIIKKLNNEDLSLDEISIYHTNIFIELSKLYKANDIKVQLHIGAIRNINSYAFTNYGADTGYDYIGDDDYVYDLGLLLDYLRNNDLLVPTIIYSLNAIHNDSLITLAGCFQEEGYKGYVSIGMPWWFNDQKIGFNKYFDSLSSLGVIANMVGMLTDSRSFISYSRHDYYRRSIANYIGELYEKNEVLADLETIKNVLADVSYYNAKQYFNL